MRGRSATWTRRLRQMDIHAPRRDVQPVLLCALMPAPQAGSTRLCVDHDPQRGRRHVWKTPAVAPEDPAACVAGAYAGRAPSRELPVPPCTCHAAHSGRQTIARHCHGGAWQAEVLRASGSTAHKRAPRVCEGQRCVRCAGAGSADTGGERGCTGRDHAATAENASMLMSVTSEVSDVLMSLMSKVMSSRLVPWQPRNNP